jgi:ATP-dependent protease ClpP protease subunit
MKHFILLSIIISICSCTLYPNAGLIVGNGEWMTGQIIVLSDMEINNLRIRHSIRRDSSTRCDKGKQNILEIVGPINPDTHTLVKRLLDDIEPCYKNGRRIVTTVYLDSGGGYLKDGFELGRVLRRYGAQASIRNTAICASSCATAFLGAKFRQMHPNGEIMFHAPYTINNISYVTGKIDIACQKESDNLKKYFIEMIGISNGEYLYQRTMNYCSASSGWSLNSDASKVFNIVNTKFWL